MDPAAADKVKQIREYLSKMTPGPWELWDGNSWRRIGSGATGRTVIEPTTYSAKDNHPDLHFTNPNDVDVIRLRTDAEWLLSQLSSSEERVREQLEIIHYRAQGELEDAETLVQARAGLQAIASYVESLLPSPPQVY